jgi:hypothetical protein
MPALNKRFRCLINLVNRKYAVQDIKKGIIGALQPDRNKTIKEVWVITRKGNLFKAKRAMVFDESIYDLSHLTSHVSLLTSHISRLTSHVSHLTHSSP